MREIILDTETTGLDPHAGHRIVEIGCVELLHLMPTGNDFHRYINPEREVPEEAVRVHGLSYEKLQQYPPMRDVIGEFKDYIRNDTLVIHNADFDLNFLNAELEAAGWARLANPIVDTLALARAHTPGAQATLDALCRRFKIDNTARTQHGALLDSQLLAAVYLQLKGGREPALALAAKRMTGRQISTTAASRPSRIPRAHKPTAEEQRAHAAFIAQIKNPLWKI